MGKIRKNKKVMKIKKLTIITAILMSIFILSGCVELTSIPDSKVVYPLYASICCEPKGGIESYSATKSTSWEGFDYSYASPKSAKTKVLKPTVSGCVGFNEYPSFRITINPGTSNEVSYCEGASLSGFIPQEIKGNTDCTPNDKFPEEGIIIDQLRKVDISAGCGRNFISTIEASNTKFNYQNLNVHLMVYPAMEGKYDLSFSDLCQRNNKIDDLIANEPTDTSIIQKTLGVLKIIGVGDVLNTGQDTSNNLKNMGSQMGLGECYVTIDKYIDLPYFGNVNPLGTYQDKDVICSRSKGLIQVEKIETEGGSNYLVPTNRLTSPSKFCCEHETCRQTYGNAFNCIGYNCEEGDGFCNSDLDCQPAGGEITDKNCFREPGTMDFFLWGSECNDNKCSGSEKKQVECCDSYCSSQGLVCDYEQGCIKPIEPDKPCPSDTCCLQGNSASYITQKCTGSLDCCSVTNGVGTCKDQCETGEEPKEICDNKMDDDADDKIDCNDNDCDDKDYCKPTCELECEKEYGLTELGTRTGCIYKCKLFANMQWIILSIVVLVAMAVIVIMSVKKPNKPATNMKAPIRKKRRKQVIHIK